MWKFVLGAHEYQSSFLLFKRKIVVVRIKCVTNEEKKKKAVQLIQNYILF